MSKTNGWCIEQSQFDAITQHHKETVFTISNGYLGTRGVFEEGFPDEGRSTFVHGVFDDVPVVFTELANIPDWLELLINLEGERFDLATGQILSFDRYLDLRTATLHRDVRWRSPAGRTSRLVFDRFASLADPHLVGVKVEITAEDYDGTVEIQSGIDVAMDNLGIKHWKWLNQAVSSRRAWLKCETIASRIELVMGISLNMASQKPSSWRKWNVRGHPTLVARSKLDQGKTVSMQKWALIYSNRDIPNPLWQIKRRLHGLQELTWDKAWNAHQLAWQSEWDRCDVLIEGDPEAQLALRFNLFQLLSAAPRYDEHANIGAKTLSGYGYRGHSFWDTEIFMLPFFTYTRPEIARNLLSYRWHNLPGARTKAVQNGYRGAQFPWESAGEGEEVTPTWVPNSADRTRLIRIWTGDIEIHISADIAYAFWQYWQATGDDDFILQRGAEVILETARFWASRLEWIPEKERYELHDVIGPDENHDHVDNNAYTNVMARWNLQKASFLMSWLKEHHPEIWRYLRHYLKINASEIIEWQRIASAIYIPYDPNTSLLEQFEGFFQCKDINLAELEPRDQSVQALFGIEGATQVQVLKQPDVLMLLYLLPDLFEEKTLRSNYDYYTPRTDHTYGSSLGPSIQAIMACHIGDPSAGYEHFMRAARADLFDVRGNAGDGIHGASAGGLWQAIIFGFAGLHRDQKGWQTRPCLPAHWTRLAFKINDHGELVTFEIKQDE